MRNCFLGGPEGLGVYQSACQVHYARFHHTMRHTCLLNPFELSSWFHNADTAETDPWPVLFCTHDVALSLQRPIQSLMYLNVVYQLQKHVLMFQSSTQLLFHIENDQFHPWIFDVSPSNWTCPGWDLLPAWILHENICASPRFHPCLSEFKHIQISFESFPSRNLDPSSTASDNTKPPLQQGKHRCDKEKQDRSHQDRWCQRWRSLASMVGGQQMTISIQKGCRMSKYAN